MEAVEGQLYYDAKYICLADTETALPTDNSILILEGLDSQIIDVLQQNEL